MLFEKEHKFLHSAQNLFIAHPIPFLLCGNCTDFTNIPRNPAEQFFRME